MRRHIPALTSLRFVAALWVFCFHLHIWHGNVGLKPLDRFLHSGPVGMAFFFVLSGFILAHASAGSNPLDDYRDYAIRRFARIYPIYLFILLASWTLNGFAGVLGDKPLRSAVTHGLADLTLTNAWFPQLFMGGHARDGTWSLSVEAFFYALFPLVLFHARRLSSRTLRLGLCWMIGLTFFFSVMGMCIQPMESQVQFALFYSFPIFRLPEFIAGVLALRDDAVVPSGRRVVWAVVGMFLFFALLSPSLPWVAQGIIAIPCLTLVFTYFTHTSAGWAAWVFSRPTFIFLGEASFALYLVQLVTIPWFKEHATGLGMRTAIALCFIATIALACFIHIIVERPMRPLVTRWLSPKSVA